MNEFFTDLITKLEDMSPSMVTMGSFYSAIALLTQLRMSDHVDHYA